MVDVSETNSLDQVAMLVSGRLWKSAGLHRDTVGGRYMIHVGRQGPALRGVGLVQQQLPAFALPITKNQWFCGRHHSLSAACLE